MVHRGRLPQGRSAQPAHLAVGQRVSVRTTSAIRGCWWTTRGASSIVQPSEGGYQQQRGLRGRRHVQLRRHGVALHGKGLPHALDLRRGGRQHARRLADLLRRPGAVLREGRMGDRRFGRCQQQHLQGAAPQAAAHAAAAAQPRAPDSEAGGATPGTASVRHPDAAQHRALQRARGAACAAAGAWDSPAKWMPSAARTTR